MKWYEDKKYQEMCEGAEEIQEGHQWKFGDFFLHRGHEPPRILVVNQDDLECGDMTCSCCEGKRIWLPSQEDLQEMYERYLQKRCDIGEYGFNVAYTFTELEEFLKTFFNLVTAGRIRKGWYPKSWVQFWLAFVMHELYQKKWNPETKKWETSK